jgi:hypothetical protein
VRHRVTPAGSAGGHTEPAAAGGLAPGAVTGAKVAARLLPPEVSGDRQLARWEAATNPVRRVISRDYRRVYLDRIRLASRPSRAVAPLARAGRARSEGRRLARPQWPKDGGTSARTLSRQRPHIN